MNVPFYHEIRSASQHIDAIAPLIKTALLTITFVAILLAVLISALLIAVIALLITVNPDLAEERQKIVTPLLRGWLKVPKFLMGLLLGGGASKGKGPMDTGSSVAASEKRDRHRE